MWNAFTVDCGKNKYGLLDCGMHSQLPIVPFGADVRADPEVNIEAGLCHCLHEPHQILPSFKIILSKIYAKITIFREGKHDERSVVIQHEKDQEFSVAMTWPWTGSWRFQKT